MNKQFILVVIALLVIWFTFISFMIAYYETMNTDPCSVCSKRMGEEIRCYTQGINPETKIYFPNGSINIKGR